MLTCKENKRWRQWLEEWEKGCDLLRYQKKGHVIMQMEMVSEEGD
jgi:hypothetical protein